MLDFSNISKTSQISIALRITTRDAEQYVPFFEKYAHTWAYCREIGKKTLKEHIHVFLICNLGKSSIKKDFQKLYPHLYDNSESKMNKSWSKPKINATDYDHLTYICKDGDVYYHNICPILIEQCKEIGSHKQKKTFTKNWKDIPLKIYTKEEALKLACEFYRNDPFSLDNIGKLTNYLYYNSLNSEETIERQDAKLRELMRSANKHNKFGCVFQEDIDKEFGTYDDYEKYKSILK